MCHLLQGLTIDSVEQRERERVIDLSKEPEFLNFEGTQESIPRNQFRQAV
jgi:hypothetical protein